MFIMLQCVILVDAAHALFESWSEKYNDGKKKYKFLLIAATFDCYAMVISVSGVMYWKFGGRICNQANCKHYNFISYTYTSI